MSYVSALPLRSGVPAELLKALAENHRWRQIYTQESVNSCLSKVHTVAYNEKNVSSVPRFIFLERFRFAHNLIVARCLRLERIGYIYLLDASRATLQYLGTVIASGPYCLKYRKGLWSILPPTPPQDFISLGSLESLLRVVEMPLVLEPR